MLLEIMNWFSIYISGYGCARPSNKSGLWLIGPLFADTFEIANELMQSMQNNLPEKETFQINVPSCNPDALKLIEGLEFVCKHSRMYTRGMPDKPNMQRVYAPASLQLGWTYHFEFKDIIIS